MTPADVFARFDRVAVAGVPQSGKTSLCLDLERLVIHTDDFKGQPWADVPGLVLEEAHGERWVVEGVQAARCLRAGLRPDAIIWLPQPLVKLTKGQASMGKGVETTFLKWMRTADWARRYVHTFNAVMVRKVTVAA